MADEPIVSDDTWERIVAASRVFTEPAQPSDDLPDFVSDDAPDLETATYYSPKSEFVSGIDIVSAYNAYSGKSNAEPGRREIKVRCPNPAHEDTNPSACLNTDKDVWVCYGCDSGGGTYEIAAYYYGYPVPEYRYGPQFREVVDRMASDFGYTGPSSVPIEVASESEPEPESNPESESEEQSEVEPQPLTSSSEVDSEPSTSDSEEQSVEQADPQDPAQSSAPVISLPPPVSEDDDTEMYGDPFDWREVYAPDGFRYAYMNDTVEDNPFPPEFFAAGADLLLGLAVGRDVHMHFMRMNAYANAYVALLGNTGIGKSLSTVPMRRVMSEVMPYHEGTGEGVKVLPEVASGEALIESLHFMSPDPITGQPALKSIEGFMHVDELAAFVTRMQRKGSTLETEIIKMYSPPENQVMATYSRTGGEVSCYEPYLSFLTGVQPDAMKNLMSHLELVNGFLNRFIVYRASRRAISASYNPVYAKPYDLTESVARLDAVRTWAQTPIGELEWSPQAAEKFGELWRALFDITQQGLRPEWARLGGVLAKLTLLATVDVRSAVIKEDHVNRAERHLRYVTSALAFTAEKLVQTQGDEAQDQIISFLRNKEWVRQSDIREKFRKGRLASYYDEAMRVLEDSGVIERQISEPGKKGGRPGVRFRLSPNFVLLQGVK